MDMRDLHERVNHWVIEAFGEDVLLNKVERSDRFFEEAIELVQATEMSRERAHVLVDHVYSRPVGDVYQEVGGVAITLSALCTAHQVVLNGASMVELVRIERSIEAIREKTKTKPRASLPK